ncbi:hypothetical protein BJF96_g5054 [Verticillium dahliae]|uniref:Uncharacterized protein n=1 Tax=Verticillium dahliae TaxID=27337 RepID=A0AA45ALQ5_VERDA|nr:hypothetical protein BJF96_g5054 [Verticillium dahliae]PNH44288.1 hypothetical protein VD0003_g9463 [Verticillium dahliae]
MDIREAHLKRGRPLRTGKKVFTIGGSSPLAVAHMFFLAVAKIHVVVALQLY